MVDQQEFDGLRELALFAGAGGGILGGHLLGWRTVCAVEWEPYAACVLAARQNDGLLPPFPIWDDVRTFDGRPWRGRVDVVSGGFPCQDISAAGKGAGIDGERSGLWGEMARIIGEVRPRYVFVENSPLLVGRGLVRVLADLADLGFNARWGVVGADDVGAPHRRKRCWIVANSNNQGPRHGCAEQNWWSVVGGGGSPDVANANRNRVEKRMRKDRELQPQGRECDQWGLSGDCGLSNACVPHVEGQRQEAQRVKSEQPDFGNAGWWESEPDVGRVAHGVAARVDRLKAIGNGQVPLCAAEAWKLLNE